MINEVPKFAFLSIVVACEAMIERWGLPVKIVPLQSSFSSVADLNHTSLTAIDISCKPASLSTTVGCETMA
jgi:hypothetical protein